jgi:hypothetical protein
MAEKTIQTGIKQNTKDFGEYGLFLGGLDVSSRNIDQFDPLREGYSRIFVMKLPRFMEERDGEMSRRFKHLIEFGFTRIDGIQDMNMDTEDITGGYVGAKFQIPNIVRDETDGVTIQVYEFSGSPVREFMDTWMTGISDPLTGLSHYHGVLDNEAMPYRASNHTMECIYVATDPTGNQPEYACMFANMMPKSVKKAHFNYSSGSHPAVQMDLEFTATKYESPQINEVANALLQKFKVLRDYLNYVSPYTKTMVGNMDGYHINNWENAID